MLCYFDVVWFMRRDLYVMALYKYPVCVCIYTAKLLTAVRRGSVDVPTQYRHASDPYRRSKKHELRLTQYR